MADHQYRNTSIYVRDPDPGLWDAATNDPDPNLGAPAPVGEYRDIVMRHLDVIRNFPLGLQFFNEITTYGKRQVIKYVGTNVPNDNSASGSGAGKARIVTQLGTGGWSAARVELDHALTQWATAHVGQDANRWLAREMLLTPLHRWDPTTTGAHSPLNPRGVLPTQANFADMVGMLAPRIADYRAGRIALKSAGSDREMIDLMVWILRDHLQSGAGSSCMIRYTPLKITVGTSTRPPQVALFHELVHAYYEARGRNLSNEDSVSEEHGRYFELAAVGLPPFDTAAYSENVFRGLYGVALRTRY